MVLILFLILHKTKIPPTVLVIIALLAGFLSVYFGKC